MKQIELYIDRQLCDLGDPARFAVYLKRQFLNPAELSKKDAQKSYTVTLPATPRNNRIFGHLNTEEVAGKFSALYDALLIVGGVTVFDGKFNLSSITRTQYKGNLGIPALKTVKDIFGNLNMNEAPEWYVNFEDWFANVSKLNEETTPPCFFPYVLYGLVPKVPKKDGNYTAKDMLDYTARLSLDDFPPSVNCLKAISHIFNGYKLGGKNLNISGTAFEDERLTSLYVSYKNPADYYIPWNYGKLADIRIKGKWTNTNIPHPRFDPTDKDVTQEQQNTFAERSVYESSNDNAYTFYTTDLLNSTNLISKYADKKLDITDPGCNIAYYEEKTDGRDWTHCSIRIPASGYYKVKLRGSVYLPSNKTWRYRDKFTKIVMISGGNGDTQANMNKNRFELKLVRDRGDGVFDLMDMQADATYSRDNFPQGSQNELAAPCSYPQPNFPNNVTNIKDPNYKPCQILFVDPAQNNNLVVGLSWGQGNSNKQDYDKSYVDENRIKVSGEVLYNTGQKMKCRILAAKSSRSWNKDARDRPMSKVIINNPDGYLEYTTGGENELVETPATRVANDNRPAEWRITNKYKINLKNSPQNYVRRGYDINDNYIPSFFIYEQDMWRGNGEVNAIVWFDRGENITLVGSSDIGNVDGGGLGFVNYTYGWVHHELEFDLQITPYRMDKDWCKISEINNSYLGEAMDWNDQNIPAKYSFTEEEINLSRFLPSDVKINDWLENFCKVFNLELKQIDQYNFELNTRPNKDRHTSLIIDLDKRAHVNLGRQNEPLDLPAEFRIGFNSDKDEQGYIESCSFIEKENVNAPKERDLTTGFDGGGKFETGSISNQVVDQSSNFSYNWYKEITINQEKKESETKEGENAEDRKVSVPIISDKEVWEGSESDYAEMQKKDYVAKAQRFWYKRIGKDSLFNLKLANGKQIQVATTSGVFPQPDQTQQTGRAQILDYKDKRDSILRNYFVTLFADGNNSYTNIETYLTPEEYTNLGNSLVRFNGDLYYVAEADGYDPLGKQKTKLKLLRKTL